MSSTDEYDYGYLKYAALAFFVNALLSTLDGMDLNDALVNEGYDKGFLLANEPIKINGNEASFSLMTPKGLKEFTITVKEKRS